MNELLPLADKQDSLQLKKKSSAAREVSPAPPSATWMVSCSGGERGQPLVWGRRVWKERRHQDAEGCGRDVPPPRTWLAGRGRAAARRRSPELGVAGGDGARGSHAAGPSFFWPPPPVRARGRCGSRRCRVLQWLRPRPPILTTPPPLPRQPASHRLPRHRRHLISFISTHINPRLPTRARPPSFAASTLASRH